MTAGDGRQALEALAAHPDIDLLFCDVIMPGELDGRAVWLRVMEAIKELQDTKPDGTMH